MEEFKRPEWAIKAENSIIKKGENMGLSEELKKEQLEGVRVFVVKNTKTSESAPMTVIYGRDFQDYDSFMKAVEKVNSDFYAGHGEDKDGLVLEDRWARNIEEFKKDNPELLKQKNPEAKSEIMSDIDELERQISVLEFGKKEAEETFRQFVDLIEKGELSSSVMEAISVAFKAHAGQKDKSGVPYILHPIRLFLQMKDDKERIVAILHDVVEDSVYSDNDLLLLGFSEEVVGAIVALSRSQGETYEEFIERIKINPLARDVKKIDIRDNSDISRIPNPKEEDFARVEKYKKALESLES